ncbi:hypothetical protein AB0L82_36435 [Nocardia sp. NPDC052001]|uniref:hypothetical protein n=1 Tax=Nocardia sp. NPDC052001 TaxID=3154853 RepID=UPI00341ADA35
MVIRDATSLIAWIESALPAVDPDAFGPWLAQSPTAGALVAMVHIRVESASLPARVISVALAARPTTRRTMNSDTLSTNLSRLALEE